MLPFEDVCAFVIGSGRTAPAAIETCMARRQGRLVVTVNRSHRVHDVTGDVHVFIDGDIDDGSSYFDEVPCICDASVWSNADHIALPGVGGPLGRYLNPGRLILRPNTAVTAALWALSVGCRPVIMLGCRCLDEGRHATHQLEAMRNARVELMEHSSDVFDGDDARSLRAALTAETIEHARCRAWAHADDAGQRLREFYR
ncbi:MAG: hypothetical protein ABFD92_16825 [Planctomycetaceae bacterium]|nr:hypothetical protein [Planctomycetaceae bacterium]